MDVEFVWGWASWGLSEIRNMIFYCQKKQGPAHTVLVSKIFELFASGLSEYIKFICFTERNAAIHCMDGMMDKVAGGTA
jgi:hypothetical protein